ncbi:MAG TPA: hypothetical protein VN088_09640 [Nocardioides sp.]|nr:hypothetical protein [Nocardioides sp.]
MTTTPLPYAATLLALGALSLLSACGSTGAGDGAAATDPATTSVAATTPTTTPTVKDADLVIAPGRLGSVRAGMTKAQWSPTRKIAKGGIVCPTEVVHWKSDPTGHRVFVYTVGTTITQLSVMAPGPHTSKGIQVGSTYADLKRVYGAELSAPAHEGWPGKTQVFVEADGDPSHSFLAFQLQGGRPTDRSVVDEIAVTDGERAWFRYDC